MVNTFESYRKVHFFVKGRFRMIYILRVYCGNEIKETEVQQNQEYKLGNFKDSIIHFDGLEIKPLYLHVSTESWCIKNEKKKAHNFENTMQEIPFEKSIVIDNERRIAVTVYKNGLDHSETINIAQENRIIIGRSNECNISLNSNQISGKHLALNRQGDTWTFEDLGSLNGTYHNYVKADSGILQKNDTLIIGFCKLIVLENTLTMIFSERIKTNIGTKRVPKGVMDISEPYPYSFKQSPRLQEELPIEAIEIQAPPSIGGKPVISWLNVLLQPILTVFVMLGICFFVTGVRTMLYFSVPMTLIGALMSIVRFNSEKKKYRQIEQVRIDKYANYMDNQIKHIEHLIKEQKRILISENPDTLQCVHLAVGPERTLWNRRHRDLDFMSIRLGSGTVPATISIKVPKQILTLEVDTLSLQPNEVADKYAEVTGCPITVEIGIHPTCGIIGDRNKCISLCKNMIVQATTHHSYDDLRVIVLCDEDERDEWMFCKWLPHIFDDVRGMRYFADTTQQSKKILDQMADILIQRKMENIDSEYHSTYNNTPFYLFICASERIIKHPIMKFLNTDTCKLGVGAIFLFNRLDDLPKECHYIVETGMKGTIVYEKEHASSKTAFTVDSVPKEIYEKFARYLAPIRLDHRKKGEGLPITISFMQGYGIKTPQMLNIKKNWGNSHPENGMEVPIGVKEGGDPFYFNIHEKHHGPHGMIAGMTGSGKSEMVQSWILAMAIRFSPEDISFVIIDFKGTGLLLPFRNLPHLAGTISDLDENIGRNLIALENELSRRKTLLDQYQVSNISAYRKLLRQGIATEPFPYLFIVIDEFAEFKLRFPDFMQAVNSIFAIGRTLGVHIILLTQKPSGAVDDKMSANTRFRWCLKVASSADSREMLHHPDAAKIVNPGRAFVQIGEDEVFEQIQSYWSGAPYNPYRDLNRQRSDKVSIVDTYGNRISYEQEKTTGYRSEKNEIDAIVEYMDAFSRKNNIPRARSIWTSKLPERIKLEDILEVAFDGEKWNRNEEILKPVVGLLDDPRSQSQYPLYLNLVEDGHVAIYGSPGSGKTTFLHTTIMSMALSYTPEMVNMYMMDFGGGSLNLFRDLPHVGGVAISGDDERIFKLTNMLQKEIIARKKMFSELGLVNIVSYFEATGKRLPYIVLLLDNFAPVYEIYPELDSFFQILARDGGSCGIFFIVTTGTQSGLNYRISQNIKSSIALRMTDKNDYISIIGRTNGIEPENYPGRGLAKCTIPLEFQTALPVDGIRESERVSNIKALISLMNRKWNGIKAQSIPIMPEQVTIKDCTSDDIFIGMACSDVSVRTLDIKEAQFLIVSAEVDASGFIHAIMKQIEEKVKAFRIVCFKENNSAEDAAENFDSEMEALLPELQKRKEQHEKGELSEKEYPYIIILIEDMESCFEKVSNETMRRLNNIVIMGQELNIILFAAAKTDELKDLYHRGEMFTINLVKSAASVLIGGTVQNHEVFKTNLKHNASITPLEKGEAYFIVEEKAEKIKCVQL